MPPNHRSRLDTQAECVRLMLIMGAVVAVLDHDGTNKQRSLRHELWTLFPFIKALASLARAHENEVLAAWEKALLEPMPFGLPPVGLPKDETP